MAPSDDRSGKTREEWLGRAIELMRPEFEAAGAPLPARLAFSCSWPSGNPRTVIGECWVAEASSRGYVEVFISPVLDQVAGVQRVLVTLCATSWSTQRVGEDTAGSSRRWRWRWA
jgi:hypothetical protein